MTARSSLPEALLSDGAFSVRQAIAAGVRPSRLRASDLAAPTSGVRVEAEADELVRHRSVLRALRSDAFLCGRSAARLHGLPLPPRLLHAIEVGVPAPARAPRRHGLVGRSLRIRDDEVTDAAVRMTSATRTFCDLARELSVPELVAIADVIGTPHAELADAIAAYPDHRLRSKLRAAAELRDVGSESPKESELRAIVRLGGLPAPRPQAIVTDAAGLFVARVDLAFDGYGEVLEYQGDHHRTDRLQWRRDRTRESKLEALGLHLMEVTQADLARPRELIDRIAANLRRRGWTGRPRWSPWFPG
ncbi:hypothetical protein [Agromyces binzhouensis]|uniref:hypothetical protein n=1 Tax=Agromyces binzhouensis TaxID=1817495 RepID=UPI00364118D8